MERVREETQEQSPQKYLIVFIDRPKEDWWDKFTRPGFRHCFMLKWDEWSNRWLMFDWRQTRTDLIILFDFEVRQMLSHTQRLRGTVVEYYPDPDYEGLYKAGIARYCSNVIARHLGLGNHVICTPYQLFRKLTATGGEVVFSWSEPDGCKEITADSRTAQTGANAD